MTKNNRKKAVAQVISTAVALGWVIMQVESAQAATFVVNNLNDSGVGSLRDTISIANNNDVVEFFLGSHPSTITLTSGALAMPAAGYAYAKNLTINGPGANLLTISGNHQFPVFDISAANVTFSGLAIAGDINAYDSSNLTFTNSTISGRNVNIDSNLTLINSTINSEDLEINGGLTGIDDSNVTSLRRITIGGNLTSLSGNLTISTGSLYINGGNIINSEAAGNITVTAESVVITGGSQVTTPININDNSGQINAGNNNSGAGGDITITTSSLSIRDGATLNVNSGSISDGLGGNISLKVDDLLLLKPVRKPSAIAPGSNNSAVGGNISITAPNGFIISRAVPEPSAIAGTILAGSLAWLAKRKQAAFRKAKV